MKASRKLNNQLITIEAFNIVTVYLDQVDFEIQVPSAYQAYKNVLELIVYLKSEHSLYKFKTLVPVAIQAIIGLLLDIKHLLVELHKEESKITIQGL